jgi:hypothetical protein
MIVPVLEYPGSLRMAATPLSGDGVPYRPPNTQKARTGAWSYSIVRWGSGTVRNDQEMILAMKSRADAAMRLAISRAVAVETSRGWRISKEKQSNKIDVVVALAMAAHVAVAVGSYQPTPAYAVAAGTSWTERGADFGDNRRELEYFDF